MSQKSEHQQQLKAAIRQTIKQEPLEHWRVALTDVDACVEPALTIYEAAECTQLQARGMMGEADWGDGNLQKIDTSSMVNSMNPKKRALMRPLLSS